MTAIDMPNNPTVNEKFTAQNGVTYIWDGEKWNSAGVSVDPVVEEDTVSVGVNPPSQQKQGDLWYNTEDGVLYLWYVDATQSAANGQGQWVDVRPGNQA